MKLTTAQRTLLAEIERRPARVIGNYRPALKLVSLGLANARQSGDFGYIEVEIIPSGRAALSATEAKEG